MDERHNPIADVAALVAGRRAAQSEQAREIQTTREQQAEAVRALSEGIDNAIRMLAKQWTGSPLWVRFGREAMLSVRGFVSVCLVAAPDAAQVFVKVIFADGRPDDRSVLAVPPEGVTVAMLVRLLSDTLTRL